MFRIEEFRRVVETIYYADASINNVDFGIIVDDNVGEISLYRKNNVSAEMMKYFVEPYRDAIFDIAATHFGICKPPF